MKKEITATIKHILQKGALLYLIIGVAYSITENLWALLNNKISGFNFIWAESFMGGVIIFFWWLIFPVLIWPVEIFWTFYYLFR